MTTTMTRLMGATCALSLMVGAAACEAGTLTTLVAFDNDKTGEQPHRDLVRLGNKLLATTTIGGSKGQGTIVSVKIAGGKAKVLSAFESYTTGAYPEAGLVEMGGLLYGTTWKGGTNAVGTIFSLDPKTDVLSVVSSLTKAEGSVAAPLLEVDGKLYGTSVGLTNHTGAIFVFDPATGVTTLLHQFDGGDGASPCGSLIKLHGKLYGTTYNGGSQKDGTLFSYDLATGAFETVYTFLYHANPYGGLVNVGGVLYGTTLGGSGLGTVFRFNPETRELTTLHSFSGPDGSDLGGKLIDVAGKLYGTASSGGAFGYGVHGRGFGTLFSVDETTGAKETLYSFTGGPDGLGPVGSLLEIDGALYGTASGGGLENAQCPDGCGTIFKFQP